MNNLWICCSIIKKEMQYCLENKLISGQAVFPESQLHMKPLLLADELQNLIIKNKNHYERLFLIYGDCCPDMIDFEKKYPIKRYPARNCAEMLTGKDLYRKLMREESFIIFSEWLSRWKEIFVHELGLTEEVIKVLFTENRKKIYYLDTGLSEISFSDLNEMSSFFNTSYEIIKFDLNHFVRNLKDMENDR